MDSSFHGFLPSEVPKKKVIIEIDENSVEYDLTNPFDFELLYGKDSNDDLLNKTESKIEFKDKESNHKTDSDDKENDTNASNAQSNKLEKCVSEPLAKRPCIESVLLNTSAKLDINSPLPGHQKSDPACTKFAPAHPEYSSVVSRCKTFRGLPESCQFLPRQLALGGFFYLGTSDRLKCFSCDAIVQQWNQEVGPWIEHKRLSPDCSFASYSDACVDQPVTQKFTETNPVAIKDGVDSQYVPRCLLIMCQTSTNLVSLRRQDLMHLMLPGHFKGKVCLSHYGVTGWSRDQVETFYSQHNTVPEIATLKPGAFKRVRNGDIFRHIDNYDSEDNVENEGDANDDEDNGEDHVEGMQTPHEIFLEQFKNIHSYCVPTPTCLCPLLKTPVQKCKGEPHTFADTVYKQLGAASTIDEIYSMFEHRSKLARDDINVYELKHHEQECTNGQGCEPYQEELQNLDKKITVLVKKSKSECPIHQFLVIGTLINEAVTQTFEEKVTDEIKKEYLPVAIRPSNPRGAEFSAVLKRQNIYCKCNEHSLSISMGCSNMRYSSNKCKFSKTKNITSKNCQRFKMGQNQNVLGLEQLCNTVADCSAQVLKQYAPVSWYNLCEHLQNANLCQLGTLEKNPFAVMSIVSQYVAHAHHDDHNYAAGCTAIISFKEPESKQCHVLPQYSFRGGNPGLAMVLPNRSIFLEVARMERHASARADQPVDYVKPSRIGLVCYTHSGLTKPWHGSSTLLQKKSTL